MNMCIIIIFMRRVTHKQKSVFYCIPSATLKCMINIKIYISGPSITWLIQNIDFSLLNYCEI